MQSTVNLVLRFTLGVILGSSLTACDIVVNLDVHEDASATFSYTSSLDPEACEKAKALAGKKYCGGINPNGKPFGEFDEQTGLFWTTSQISRESLGDSKTLRSVHSEQFFEVDDQTHIVSVRVPVSELQNLASAGPNPNKRKRVATEFKTGAPELWEGHTMTFTITAKEILETNGVVNEDRTKVTFAIPSIYYAYGLGDPGYEYFSVKARY